MCQDFRNPVLTLIGWAFLSFNFFHSTMDCMTVNKMAMPRRVNVMTKSAYDLKSVIILF